MRVKSRDCQHRDFVKKFLIRHNHFFHPRVSPMERATCQRNRRRS